MRKLAVALTLSCLPLLAAEPSLVPAAPAGKADPKAAFEKLKGLAGEWTGEVRGVGPATVTWRVISGGSAVVENIFPGAEQEMMTVYYLDAGQLVATHYCGTGNQPRFKLGGKSTAGELFLDFTGGSNLKPATDTHMHSGRIKFVEPDKLETEWSFWQQGKQTGAHVFELSRKK